MFGLARVCAFAGVALATTQPCMLARNERCGDGEAETNEVVGFEDTLVARDIEIRQDKPKCDPKGYTSLNGLNFTSFCDQNNPFNGTPRLRNPTSLQLTTLQMRKTRSKPPQWRTA